MEDKILAEYIKIHGEGKWRNLPKRAGLMRCGKSCRLRWLNYLRPDIKRGNITHDEEELIIRLHKLLGNRWSLIAGRLPGRTDNEIKNYWNTNIGKKIQIQGDHPNHSPKGRPSSQLPQEQKQHPTIEGSRVVHTKATRCTKVVVTCGPQALDQFHAQAKVVEPSLATTHDPVDFSKSISEETNYDHLLNFMMDFDQMDGNNFLSDFLNMDFSQLSRLENEGENSINTCAVKGHSSPTSNDQKALFVSDHDHTLHGSDFHIEPGLEWLCD